MPPFVEVRALCDINPAQLEQADEIAREEQAAGPRALRRLEGDAREGRHRGGHHGAAAVHARRSRRRLPRRGQARAVREDDGVGRRRLRAHARRRAAETSACSRSATSASTARSTTAANEGISRRPARRGVPRAARVASQRELAAAGRAAQSPDYDPSRLGLPDVRAPAQLAAVQEVLARAVRRAGQPSVEHRQLVLRRRRRRRSTRRAASTASRTAARAPTTCTARSSIRAGARPCSRRSNRTRSTTTTRCSSGTKGTLILSRRAGGVLVRGRVGRRADDRRRSPPQARAGARVAPRRSRATGRPIRARRRPATQRFERRTSTKLEIERFCRRRPHGTAARVRPGSCDDFGARVHPGHRVARAARPPRRYEDHRRPVAARDEAAVRVRPAARRHHPLRAGARASGS